jgi:hypothetical protein
MLCCAMCAGDILCGRFVHAPEAMSLQWINAIHACQRGAKTEAVVDDDGAGVFAGPAGLSTAESPLYSRLGSPSPRHAAGGRSPRGLSGGGGGGSQSPYDYRSVVLPVAPGTCDRCTR